MKKKPSLVLVFFALLIVLTSCGFSDNTQNSEDSSPDLSDYISQEPEESKETFAPAFETPVSIGKKYTGTPHEVSYPDTYGTELTDGLYAGDDKGYSDPKWSNYSKPDPVFFVIDLEEDSDRLYKFEVSYYYEIGPGIATPQNITVHSSNEQSPDKWDFVCNIITGLDSETGAYKVSNTLNEPINARYIKFSMNHYAGNLFLDELTVYADVEGTTRDNRVADAINNYYNSDDYVNLKALETLATGTIDFDKELVCVSTDTTYTLSTKPSVKFPDNRKLTNGKKIGSIYESGEWVSFESDGPIEITVDLKQVADDISVFTVSCHQNIELGVVLPVYVDVLVSSDNKNFTKIGRVYSPLSLDSHFYNYTLSLSKSVQARYIKYVLSPLQNSVLMIEEVQALAYRTVEQKPYRGFYAETPIAKITSEKLFSSKEPDYNERINLILGKGQRIYPYFPLSYEKGVSGNTPETSKLLTDGIYAQTADYTDSRYFKFGSSHGRDVVFDLGATGSVDGFGVSFLRQDSVGINVLTSVIFYLSEDGVNWYSVMVGTTPSSQATEILRYEFALDRAYKARYARFGFKVWPNAYCDELEVWGTKKVNKSTVALKNSGITPSLFTTDEYTSRDSGYLGGAKDIVLVPNYSAADEQDDSAKKGYSKEELIPYVAYIDPSGDIVDTFFDGFLFCPTGRLLEGGHAYKSANMREVKDMTDKLFDTDRDLDALEKAVGEVKSALKNMEDYKAQFYFTLCYPGDEISFGDIYNTGNTEILDTKQKRIDAVIWAIDDFLELYSRYNYNNIEFSGFYWVHESTQANRDDPEILKAVSDYCHSKGYEIFWIPYFASAGFDQWHSFGFDVACMQPNFAFSTSAPEMNIEYCAYMAHRFGMCVEMEISGPALTDPIFFQKYMDYLTGGIDYGYMKDTIHMYYQDLFVYYNAYKSTDPKARLIYDYTYSFAKGTLSKDRANALELSFDASSGTILSGNLNTADSVGEYYLAVSPGQGSVTILPNGEFAYYPEKGFVGTDTFEYFYTDYLGVSKAATVTIVVS